MINPDLAAQKAKSLNTLEVAFRESCRLKCESGYGVIQKPHVLRSKRKGTPRSGYLVLWRNPATGDETELVWVPDTSSLTAVNAALYIRLTELRSRSNVIEFPQCEQRSA